MSQEHPEKDIKPKKRGLKSKAELAAPLEEQELAEVKTRHLELQPSRSLEENLADLPKGCDWGGKQNSKGKTEYWYCIAGSSGSSRDEFFRWSCKSAGTKVYSQLDLSS